MYDHRLQSEEGHAGAGRKTEEKREKKGTKVETRSLQGGQPKTGRMDVHRGARQPERTRKRGIEPAVWVCVGVWVVGAWVRGPQ